MTFAMFLMAVMTALLAQLMRWLAAIWIAFMATMNRRAV